MCGNGEGGSEVDVFFELSLRSALCLGNVEGLQDLGREMDGFWWGLGEGWGAPWQKQKLNSAFFNYGVTVNLVFNDD